MTNENLIANLEHKLHENTLRMKPLREIRMGLLRELIRLGWSGTDEMMSGAVVKILEQAGLVAHEEPERCDGLS